MLSFAREQKMYKYMTPIAILCAFLFLLFTACGKSGSSPAKPVEEQKAPIVIVDFSKEADVSEGAEFKDWMQKKGWLSEFGSPEYFFIKGGALNMVSKAGPVFNSRLILALTDRQRLMKGMENKVILQIAGGADFRIRTDELPKLHFKMSPVELPGSGADLRDSSRNDCAFYLLVGFDTELHDYEGVKLPETVAYVWADQAWEAPVGRDPDYEDFFRYIPIGCGEEALGKPQEITRDIASDFLLAYPEEKGKTVPDVIKIGLMIDSNTVDSTAKSQVFWIRLEPG